MSHRSRRAALTLILLLAVSLPLLFVRCSKSETALMATSDDVPSTPVLPTEPVTQPVMPSETLAPATIQVPTEVAAGASFRATWTGPDNTGDYLTIVRPDSKPGIYENYRETRHGAALELTAPIEAGNWEVRYVAARSKTVLGRAPLVVNATSALLIAADEVMLGAPVSIAWTGPNNAGDFVCIVPKDAPDHAVGNYTDVAKGSPLTVKAPVDPGEAEIRYVAVQGRKVLGRRKVVVLAPETSITAGPTVVAGAAFPVSWKGPANAGDYVTVVPKKTPDGEYRNYADTSKGSPLELLAPIESGEAEIRYMTGSGRRVLARRTIAVVPAAVHLEAVEQASAGAPITIVWTGPKNRNDYITIVPQSTPDGQYANYADVTKGSPLTITAPAQAGVAEIRYMSGQGARVLARRTLILVSASRSGAAKVSSR